MVTIVYGIWMIFQVLFFNVIVYESSLPTWKNNFICSWLHIMHDSFIQFWIFEDEIFYHCNISAYCEKNDFISTFKIQICHNTNRMYFVTSQGISFYRIFVLLYFLYNYKKNVLEFVSLYFYVPFPATAINYFRKL